jgi:hypothetical protein
MRKLLLFLFILQEVSNKNREPKLGRGFIKAYRFNPFNPLSYVALILIIIVGLVMFGVVGFWREADCKNPFKWN